MDVLVDYYNIPEQERRKGVPYVVDRIMATMVPNHVDDRHRRVDIRLYGGWYEERSLTRDAQQIERALSGPIRLPVDSRRSLIVHVEHAKGAEYLRSGSADYVDLSLFTESSDGIG